MDGTRGPADLASAVTATVKASEGRGYSPAAAALEAARCARERGAELPSPELGLALVTSLCFENNTPFGWKLLDAAVAARILSPLHTIALLTARAIPNRRTQPEAYRLYLELLSRYIFASPPMGSGPCRERITKCIDNILQLSRIYGVCNMEYGHAVMLCLLCVITHIIDATLEDWGLQLTDMDKLGSVSAIEGHQAMDIDAKKSSSHKRQVHCEQLSRINALMAFEMVEKITADKKSSICLRFIYLNMPEKFNRLLQRLQFIQVHQSISQNLISANEILVKLMANIQKAMSGEFFLEQHQLIGVLTDVRTRSSVFCNSYGLSRTACWIPIDTFMESAMDGRQFHAISAIEILAELTKTLQVINQATWQETFHALWVSALRLVQRDHEPLEGPIPHLDARLCMLFSLVPLAVNYVFREESETPFVVNSALSSMKTTGCEHGMEGDKYASKRRGLISSLQLLGQFSSLLSPPPSVVVAANMAATRAATFVTNSKKGNVCLGGESQNKASAKADGNMLHLIVEACIARKLIDTSAYFWPGFVGASAPANDSVLLQESPWSAFMEGASLTSSLRNALIATPASSKMALDKLYHIALDGPEEEQSAAAKILCGASLSRGWNIQEHAVHIVIKLLSPPAPSVSSATGSHLVAYKSMLTSILHGLSSVDMIHILSLYGMVPEIAAALMPICETFGSLSPVAEHKSASSDEISSVYSVFSLAFLFLLRLWKFYGPPQEQYLAGRGGTVKMQFTLNYLLLMRNSRIALQKSTALDGAIKVSDLLDTSPGQPVYIESFPKLRSWYCQNEACIVSPLSGLCSKNPVHQVANKILNMICQKMISSGRISDNTSTRSGEDAYQISTLPAWEILEAVPFVLEAVLTACAHGRLSSRDLTTSLRDLVDFLPASFAIIISYFSAEITRGIWKPVLMNGIDWPSPAANLFTFESEIKEILELVGVHVPSCYAGGVASPMLPLPMAALVGLTITFKLDRSLEYIHGVAGQALENSAISCSSWPSMTIIGSLWSQKVRRWHDFILLSCACSPFTQDKEAISQLITSCFSAFLGSSPTLGSHPMACRGVSGLLGQAISAHGTHLFNISPGVLYLRSCRTIHDTRLLSSVILRLVIKWSREPVILVAGRRSLDAAAERAREAATLGASLLCIAGGFQLVLLLYEETLPTMLLSMREGDVGGARYESCISEGYAMAWMIILSGALVWGVGTTSMEYKSMFSLKRARVIGAHMDFMAGVVEGNVTPGCDPATWRAYVSCFVSLLVSFVPEWVPEVRQETLRRLASGLRGLGEEGLSLALLERGGPAAVEAVVDSLF